MANNPLQSSGTMSFSDIRLELAVPTQAPFALDLAENGTYATINQCSPQRPSGSNPAAVSEWYSYNHIATASVFLTNTEGPSATSAGACALANANQWTLYVVGTIYYRNSTCTTLLNQFYRDSTATNWYEFSNGVLISQGACTTTTTTTTTTVACTCNRAGECGAGCDCPYPTQRVYPCTSTADCNFPCL